ncbi:large ribosomal subunit protein uL23m [Neocloeon triangulifer]|uniref:large ribosomal subunit protein uL23m n=1 Tax=Neocloeon triangulifer TaxID=2078957 RepID=UPI00286F5FAC|nr:large ribosomal subunit protein uL23m [Neocloeon triangulifer]
MSTRWYPLYQRGNPQLRVFLPNFFMKLVKPRFTQPPNVVTFEVSMEMTRYDVKNYLEKIYKIPVITVRTEVTPGELNRKYGYVTKEDDVKTAFVELEKSVNFTFPDLFASSAKDDDYKKEMKNLEEMKRAHRKQLDRNGYRPGIPGWFTF